MSKNEELQKLFEEWKVKHKEESYNSNTIEVLHIDKDSWCEDGFAFAEKSNTILYVLSESNLNGDNKCNGEFWFKENYEQINHPIIDKIQLMQETLCEKIENLDLKDISYMNINKRGGYSTANENTLNAYYEKYKDFIIKEINIIDPKLIIFATGEKGKAIFIDLVNNKEKLNCKDLIFMSHPSIRGVSNTKYIEEFKEKLKKLNIR